MDLSTSENETAKSISTFSSAPPSLIWWMKTTSKAEVARAPGELAEATLIVMEAAQAKVATAQAVAGTKVKVATKLKEVAMVVLVAMAEAQAVLASSKAMITLVKVAVMMAASLTGAVALLKRLLRLLESVEAEVFQEAISKKISKTKAILKVALAIRQPSRSLHQVVAPAAPHPIRFSSRTLTVTTQRMT